MSKTETPTVGSRVLLDVVTPTHNRHRELLEQAELLGPQLLPGDRWIVVDDASGQSFDVRRLAACLPKLEQILFVALTYSRGDAIGTVNRARHVGCTLARNDAWIVELDDHDYIEPRALELVRAAIHDGAVFVYGDVLPEDAHGQPGEIFRKPDYRPWLLRDETCPCEGVRAFPKTLYDQVGGYRWQGHGKRPAVGGNEFPAGDYGLYLRMEAKLEGTGFVRIPHVLNRQPKVPRAISTRYHGQQAEMAGRLRDAARRGVILNQ